MRYPGLSLFVAITIALTTSLSLLSPAHAAKPKMAYGDPILLGALTKEQVMTVIETKTEQMRACYGQELTQNPDLYGKVVIKFVVSRDGTVSSARVNSSSLNNDAVEQCMCEYFMEMIFPSPDGGGIVIITFPYLFGNIPPLPEINRDPNRVRGPGQPTRDWSLDPLEEEDEDDSGPF